MSILSDNIRLLRSRKDFSQQKLADELKIGLERLKKYEQDRSEPPIDVLKRISAYFHVSIDLLVSFDLRKVDVEKLASLENNRIVLPITVDSNGKDSIEIIPHKAKAGYLTGYSDPEYIENLQRISLPFLTRGKYRAFPIEGDSMPPHQEGSFVIGKYLESPGQMKNGRTYVLVTSRDGIVYKRVLKKDSDTFTLVSDNTSYHPFEVKADELYEIWEYACSIATAEFEPDDLSNVTIKRLLIDIKKAVTPLNK